MLRVQIELYTNHHCILFEGSYECRFNSSRWWKVGNLACYRLSVGGDPVIFRLNGLHCLTFASPFVSDRIGKPVASSYLCSHQLERILPRVRASLTYVG